jgi:1-acyl-sn-glycerol-3-phosphate acyltransferase
MNFLWRVASIAAWTLAIAVITFAQAVLFVVYLATRASDPERRRVARMFHSLGISILGLHPWVRVHVDSKATLPYGEPCVIVSNHESDLDVYLSSELAIRGWNAKYLSKQSLYDLPVLGWGMRMAGDIPVVRNDRRSRAQAAILCRTWLERGVPVFIFPEGTRSRTGEMGSFKDGAFRLAIETGSPVQPIVYAGTRDALPPGAFLLRPSTVALRVLDPVPVAGLTLADAGVLAKRVEDMVRNERNELRRAHGMPVEARREEGAR